MQAGGKASEQHSGSCSQMSGTVSSLRVQQFIALSKRHTRAVHLGMQSKHCQPVMAPVIQGSQAASQAWNWSGVMPSCSRRPLASAPFGTRANCARHPPASEARYDHHMILCCTLASQGGMVGLPCAQHMIQESMHILTLVFGRR